MKAFCVGFLTMSVALGSFGQSIFFLPEKDRYEKEKKIEDKVSEKFSSTKFNRKIEKPSRKFEKKTGTQKRRKNTKKDEIIKTQKMLIKQQQDLLNIKLTTSQIVDFSQRLRFGQDIAAISMDKIDSTNRSPLNRFRVVDPKFPKNTMIFCKVNSINKVVEGECVKMVTPVAEYDIEASLHRSSGAFGLKGTVINGKDKYVGAVLAAKGVEGALAISRQFAFQRDGDAVIAPTGKNMAIQAGMNVADTGAEMLMDEMKKTETRIYVEPGAKVLIRITKSMNLSKRRSM